MSPSTCLRANMLPLVPLTVAKTSHLPSSSLSPIPRPIDGVPSVVIDLCLLGLLDDAGGEPEHLGVGVASHLGNAIDEGLDLRGGGDGLVLLVVLHVLKEAVGPTDQRPGLGRAKRAVCLALLIHKFVERDRRGLQ